MTDRCRETQMSNSSWLRILIKLRHKCLKWFQTSGAVSLRDGKLIDDISVEYSVYSSVLSTMSLLSTYRHDESIECILPVHLDSRNPRNACES